MIFIKITLLVVFFGLLTLGMSDNTTSTLISIDSQIAIIKAAPAKERVQMMNEFKQRLANMNQQKRMNTIAKMQEKFQGKTVVGSTMNEQVHTWKDKDSRMSEMMKARTQEMAQETQMQSSEQMSHMQNMNQMKAGNQFMNENYYKPSIPMNSSPNGGWIGGSNSSPNGGWNGGSNSSPNGGWNGGSNDKMNKKF